MKNVPQATIHQQKSCNNRITEEKNQLAEMLLQLAVQLICLQTGEQYVVLKKYGEPNHCIHPRSSYRMRKSKNSIMELPSLSLTSEKNIKVIKAASKIIELLTGEVPIRCQDFTVYFSMDEWKYLEEHKDFFIMENKQLFGSDGCFKSDSRQISEKISETDNHGNYRTEAMLNITKELIDLLTGERYILVKTSRKVSNKQTSEYPIGCQGSANEPLSHHVIHKKDNNKILETSNRILQLLLGEVPIRCHDITVHFSKEEWEYLERQKDFNTSVILENTQPLVSVDENLSSKSPFNPCQLEVRNKKDVVITSTQNRVAISRGEKESIHNWEKNFPSSVGSKAENGSMKKSFPCSECGRCFSTKYTLKTHWRWHTGIGIISCTECDKHFSSEYFKIHQRTHTGLKPFSCSQCHKRFTTSGSLAAHENRHFLEVCCSCPKCGQSFKSKTILQSHLFSHHICSACGQDFDRKYDLEDHMRSHPALKKQYSCTECGKYFIQKGSLKAHYRVHTGEKPFPCLECGKTFTYKSHLVSHQRFHTGEVLSCRFCEKIFVDRARLVEHERIHTGEKPFACSECGKQFSRKYHLSMHQRIHTDIRPYECSACGKCFACKTTAERHCKQRRCKMPKALN